MGEQSMRQSAWGHYYNYHTTDRRGQSVGGSRVPFARDTWEGSLSLSLSVSPVYLNLSFFSLSGARTHTHTQIGAHFNNNLHFLVPNKTYQ